MGQGVMHRFSPHLLSLSSFINGFVMTFAQVELQINAFGGDTASVVLILTDGTFSDFTFAVDKVQSCM